MNPQSQNVAVVPETAQLVHGTTPPPCWAVWSWRQWKRNGRQHYAHAIIEGRRKTLCGVPVYCWWELGEPASAGTIHCAECRAKLPNTKNRGDCPEGVK